jgi:hypothetical protein
MTRKEGLEMVEKTRNSFILSDQMREYFLKIGIERNKGSSKSGHFPTNVHPFYFCMIMGIAKNKNGNPQLMTKDMVDEWKGDAAKNDHFISGLTFFMHCKRHGLVTDQTSDRVLKQMSVFFSNTSNKGFSTEGYSLMNRFAQGGFEIIAEELEGITDLADWFSLYLGLLTE